MKLMEVPEKPEPVSCGRTATPPILRHRAGNGDRANCETDCATTGTWEKS
ncbi:hypothetical protein J9T75_004136 [Salmonella enterica]|nr:hypothetical protein [Salmonella enterica]HDO5801212.1 hypothetical protein [Salmonella enterica subsp. enterica serovar Typhimurium]HED0202373.1 hypothetical protein [Salmonella enterica subsp. enterica serovar Orientalis]